MKFSCTLLSLLIIWFSGNSQNISQSSFPATDTSLLNISLLTCAPGTDLYATFGHTAIRVQNKADNTDLVFNYGTFDFDQPNFYLNFVKGRLDFTLSVSTFTDFLYEYQMTQRSVEEQVLNLNFQQKEAIFSFLQHNYLPQNRHYKYDFLLDNCATRIRDILFNKNLSVVLNHPIVPLGTSFRDLIHDYLDKGGQPWSKLGIDILLGSVVDKKVDAKEAMFLPDFLYAAVENSSIDGKPYELNKHMIINAPTPITATGKYVPFILVTVLCAIFLIMYLFLKKSPVIIHLLDSFLLYITGILGVLIMIMWFATDHKSCANNFNLLWALPTNLIVAFFIWKRRDWLKKYFFIATLIEIFLMAFWFGLPQTFNIAILPLAILMMIRYGQLARQ